MAYEIEMKAWVLDWEALEATLRDRCTFERLFRKEDRYFATPDGEGLVRVRIDAAPGSAGRALGGGSCGAYVTSKEKHVHEGMERNLEREFGVDDAEAFIDLVTSFGCRETFAKTKAGLRFTRDGLTVELARVQGLGDFLEVECVVADDNAAEGDAARHREAAARIRAFFSELGVPDERIEPRPYMQLLRERRGEG
ncbi:MAG: CYTH domain-containing protein [Spirochaetota bacterium]